MDQFSPGRNCDLCEEGYDISFAKFLWHATVCHATFLSGPGKPGELITGGHFSRAICALVWVDNRGKDV